MLIVVHYCYRFLCTVVTDSCALLLPFFVHSPYHFLCTRDFCLQQVPHAVIQAKHGSTTSGLLPVSSPRPGCPGSAIPPLSACASLCSSVWALVPTSCLCLFSCLSAPVPESCHSLAPPGGTPLIPARWPEPRRICVCSHRTATRLSRFLSDGSCMRLLSPCSIELSLRFLLV